VKKFKSCMNTYQLKKMMILCCLENDLSSLRKDTEPEYDSSSGPNVDQAENDTEE
jgi:hypothetical protein